MCYVRRLWGKKEGTNTNIPILLNKWVTKESNYEDICTNCNKSILYSNYINFINLNYVYLKYY
jgi:hypothetical protein